MDKQTVGKISKEFIARLFVYAAASAFLGSAMLMLIQTLQLFMDSGGGQAIAAWAVVAATWANLSFLLSRRFISKVYGYRWYPVAIPVLLCVPVPLFMLIRPESILPETGLILVPLIVLSAAAGYFLGKKAGDLRRKEITG